MKEDVSILRPSSIEDIFFSYYGCLEMSPKSTNAEHGLDNVILNIPDDLDESNLFNSDEDVLRTIDLSEFEDNTSENLEQLDNLLKDSILEDYSDSYSVLGVNLNLSCNITSEGMVNHNDGINIIGNLDPWVEETVDNIVYKELLTNTSFDNVLAENAQEISRGNLPLQSTDAEIYNLLPPITEEKNVKRRSLLYERSVKLDNPHNENLNNNNNSNKKYQALMTHDYTHRRSEDNKFFPCSVVNCDRVYSKSSHLKAHLKRHSGEKPFVCNWNNCTWKFSRSDELARHRRSHLGIKPYKCELCERAFARSDHLAKHHKVHKRKMAQFGNFQIKRRIRLK